MLCFVGHVHFSFLLFNEKTKVNRPFSNLFKLNKTLNNHSMVNYHWHCLQDADILKSTIIDNPARHIDVMASSAIRMNENKQ